MRKRYSADQKANIGLELLKEDHTLAQIAATHGLRRTQLCQWKAQALAGLPNVFSDEDKVMRVLDATHGRRVAELYTEIGRLTTQVAGLR